MNTTVDIQRISYKRFGKNALIVLRVPDMAIASMSALNGLTKQLRAKVDPSVSVLWVRDDIKVELLDEKVMNRGGWYRKPVA